MKSLLPRAIRGRELALIALSAGFAYLSLRIVEPFLAPLTWGGALAILSYPLYMKLDYVISSRAIRAGVIVAALAIVIVAPTVWMSRELVNAGLQGIAVLFPTSAHDAWHDLERVYPRVAEFSRMLAETFHISEVTQEIMGVLRRRTTQLLTLSITGLVHALLTLFVAFFLLRDGPRFLSGLKQLIPLPSREIDKMYSRISDTIHATLFGVVAVSMVQGLLGGLLFWWLEIPGATIWGIIMAMLALVPYLGAFVVWIPVAIFLALKLQWGAAICAVVWGTIVIGFSDNVLYPILVGKRLHYHSLVVFVFLLGGVIVFGAAGVVLGPVVLAISDCLSQFWHARPSPAVAAVAPPLRSMRATGPGDTPPRPATPD